MDVVTLACVLKFAFMLLHKLLVSWFCIAVDGHKWVSAHAVSINTCVLISYRCWWFYYRWRLYDDQAVCRESSSGFSTSIFTLEYEKLWINLIGFYSVREWCISERSFFSLNHLFLSKPSQNSWYENLRGQFADWTD